MFKTLEDEIIHLVTTSADRDFMRDEIARLVNHTIDSAVGDQIAAATHRIRKIVKPINLGFYTVEMQRQLETFAGRWFTTEYLVKVMAGDTFENTPEGKKLRHAAVATTARNLATLYRAGYLEQRVLATGVSQASARRGAFASWNNGLSQRSLWRYVRQEDVINVFGTNYEESPVK